MNTDVAAIEAAVKGEDTRTGSSVESLKRAFIDNLIYEQGRFPAIASRLDYYMAIAASVRDRLLERWASSVETYVRQDARIVCYLSAEYLLGKQLGNNLLNLGLKNQRNRQWRVSDPKLSRFSMKRKSRGLATEV